MSTPTKTNTKTNKRKQWLWFIGIWISSLLTVISFGYMIKFLMSLI